PDSAPQRADVIAVLDGMARDDTLDADWRDRTIEVLNKADLLGGIDKVPIRPGLVAVSAITGEGLLSLLTAIDARIAAGMELADYDLPPEDGARLAWLYQHGEVLERHDADAAIHVTVRLRPEDKARFEQHE
ncbi:MAG TPA: GTPase HflX, partial [Acetobacteraceae bacterium]